MRTNRGKWPGGHINAAGVYIIRRSVGGVDLERSTRATTLRGAMAQLERFEADPLKYSSTPEPAAAPLVLDVELAKKFLAWSRDVKKNSVGHRRDQKYFIDWWAKKLDGCDLREVSLQKHILPALDEEPEGRAHKIAKLKVLFAWLRKVRFAITPAQDPLFGTLAVPQGSPEQERRRKARSPKELERVWKVMVAVYRDALDVQLGTGWHGTELERFARDGELEPATPDLRAQGAAGVLITRHENRRAVKQPVRKRALEAARRLRARGGISLSRYAEALRSACELAGVEQFAYGQLRHTVLTYARRKGATKAETRDFAHHTDDKTTERFYANEAPRLVPTLR